MNRLVTELNNELTNNILPFWISRMTDPDGGFYGRMDGCGTIHTDAERGAILNARLLWTFSSAYRLIGHKEYLVTAQNAFSYIKEHFVDWQFGGVFWSLDSDGSPLDTKKQFYAIAFMIYGLSEYYRATSCVEALKLAIMLFHNIEDNSLDRTDGGYIEACTREWSKIEDMRLSEKDQNDAKTMNTHLHILEAYTGLYRVWKDESLAMALKETIEIFLDRIIQPDGHLGLFFGEDWKLHSTLVSYGHDIEASWLLYEAAEVLGDQDIMKRVKAVSSKIADAALEGFTPDGGMEYEYDPASGCRNSSRDWWVQAESVVGFVNQFQTTGDKIWMERATAGWEFIRHHIICPDGEWYWSALPDGNGSPDGLEFSPNTVDDRAGFWKCPYHNGRMCMEVIERLSNQVIMKEKLYPLKFIPIASPRPWGGTALVEVLGKKFSEEAEGCPCRLIGESWELADMGGQNSVVGNGYLEGKTIADIMKTYQKRVVGENVFKRYGTQFPLLIKFLDIEGKLSVQVHPDDKVAAERYGSLGKAEVWYVLDAKADAKIYMGFARDVSPEEFSKACKSGTADQLLNVIHPKRGDVIFIKPGTVHAAEGGILICEIQESSDMTFRLYDWGRENNPATARKMHLDEAVDIIDYKKYERADRLSSGLDQELSAECIADCPQFTVNHLILDDRILICTDRRDSFLIYSCIKGKVSLEMDEENEGTKKYTLEQGDTILVPAECPRFTLNPLEEKSELLESFTPSCQMS